MSCSSSFGSSITPPRYSSRSSRNLAAPASFAASPLSSSTHTALSPLPSRSAICFLAGESDEHASHLPPKLGADQMTASFRIVRLPQLDAAFRSS
jgi:hypothetical protein